MDNENIENVDSTNNGTEGGAENETIAVAKPEYDKLQNELGSLKRQLKDLKKPKEESKETVQTKPDESKLIERIEKVSLRQAGIDHPDDIELARQTAKKWNMEIEDVLLDDDFKVKLERQQTGRANTIATSGVKGGAGQSQAKNTPEYWVAKGTPPSATDVPDRKTRAKIVRAMMTATNTSKTFYND